MSKIDVNLLEQRIARLERAVNTCVSVAGMSMYLTENQIDVPSSTPRYEDPNDAAKASFTTVELSPEQLKLISAVLKQAAASELGVNPERAGQRFILNVLSTRFEHAVEILERTGKGLRHA